MCPILSSLWLSGAILHWDTHRTIPIYHLTLLGYTLLSCSMVRKRRWVEPAICSPCLTCLKLSNYNLKCPVNPWYVFNYMAWHGMILHNFFGMNLFLEHIWNLHISYTVYVFTLYNLIHKNIVSHTRSFRENPNH